MSKLTGSCNCREALALCPACREQALCDKYEEIKTMARPGNVSKMENTLTIEQMAQKSTDMHVAALCRITQVSPHEYKLGYLAGYREALERAATTAQAYPTGRGADPLPLLIRKLSESGDT